MNSWKAYKLRQLQQKKPRPVFQWLSVLLLGLMLSGVLLVAAGAGGAFAVYAYYSQQLPSAEEFGKTAMSSFKSTKVYDRTGEKLLYEIVPPEEGARTVVPLHQIPEYLRYATIALEDRSFYENPYGINISGLFRSFINNLRGLPVQGGSSIAQQLVRNVVMTSEERYTRSYDRKIKEVILAFELSRRFPGVEGKDRILEWYLNLVSYGFPNGVEAASEFYFGKHVWELDLAESAMLAHLPNAPSLNPIDDLEAAKARQAIVLDQMYLQGYITAEEAWNAKQEKLTIVSKPYEIVAPHWVMYVRKQLEDRFGLDAVYRGGLKVITSLDLELQNEAERIAREHIATVSEKHKVHNAAVVVIDAQTGEILCMVGSLNYFDSKISGQVNVATSERQPGSSFKPFTYVTAFAQGYSPASMVMDVRTSFPDDPNPPYVPENNDRKFRGPVSLRTALGNSLNVPAVAMLYQVGVKNVLETAHRMGINTLTRPFYGLSLTLGGGEVTLLDLAYAYSVFANQGQMVGEPVATGQLKPGFRTLNPVSILRIEDSQGQVVYEHDEPQRTEVLRPQLAYLITDVLSDSRARTLTFAWDSPIQMGPDVAVKTGSTNDYRDAWTIGYTNRLVVGVWVGNSDNTAMENMPGSRGAGPIWRGVMDWLLQRVPASKFVPPDGLERVEVDATSGLLPTQYSPRKVKDIFIQGNAPTKSDDVHVPVRICQVSGKRATAFCPPETTVEQVFEVYPAEASDWVRESQIPQPPTEYCDLHGPSATTADIAITRPALYSQVTGVVPIWGNARPGDFRLYQVRYGSGMSPSAWVPIGGDHYDRVDNNILEYWDVSQLKDGLYTLELVVVEGSGNYRSSRVQAIVDNTAPKVEIIHPLENAVYTLESDEWVNIQVDAVDNYSMDRVEFFLDGQQIGYSTVAPFTKKWTIALTNTLPALSVDPLVISSTAVITTGDLYIEAQTWFDGRVITITRSITDMHVITRTAVLTSGFGVISDTAGYTETHLVHVIGYDSAGNKTESEKVRIYTIHKPKEEKKETPTPQPVGQLWLPNRRKQQPLTG
ncbi:MAG: Penicillin-binding protein 2D [Chloroflexi bacterium ADurb.Bin180]|nr:MAG: Penicillin-binding protein 2D [Chloroflexi bacterium ADurb.Bin180]HQJ51109.1 transglycosylase domain-containing protein [Anaerolineae bacterium]